MSLYPFHSADEIAAFTKPQRAAYDRERAAFNAEVADLVAAIRRDGGIQLQAGGRPFRVPVQLTHDKGAVYRDTVGLGWFSDGTRGAP